MGGICCIGRVKSPPLGKHNLYDRIKNARRAKKNKSPGDKTKELETERNGFIGSKNKDNRLERSFVCQGKDNFLNGIPPGILNTRAANGYRIVTLYPPPVENESRKSPWSPPWKTLTGSESGYVPTDANNTTDLFLESPTSRSIAVVPENH